ncbi:MAG: hemolysin family protein [Vicinamibacteria bacterium]|nr:hemolysin family protein [Vicinamibacteria bacterium]
MPHPGGPAEGGGMTLLGLLGILLLVVASIGLATIEAAFYLVKRRNLHKLADEDSPEMEKLARYFEDPPSMLMPIHIGTYTAHVAMTVLVTILLIDLLNHWAMLVALVTMVLYLLIFRLTLPAAIARRAPERVLLTLIRPYHRYAILLRPLTTVLRKRATGIDEEETNGGTGAIRIPAALREIPPPALLAENESRIVDSLARFSETHAREVMTPRLDIVGLPTSSTVAEARKLFRESQYSRLVAYTDSLDDIAGILTVRDLVSYEGPETDTIQTMVRPTLVVPDGKRIVDLLREMQSKRITLAILVDEYGVTAGLVSVEDILEELVGEIKDEYDNETEPLVVTAEGVISASARVSLETLKDALDPGFDMPDDVDTVGGLAMNLFGHVPKAGEKIEHEGYTIEVLEATPKRVGRVQFARAAVEVEQ